jgi:two-component system, chemotaxis family, protein-glutamate methylesterase/glutaminase
MTKTRVVIATPSMIDQSRLDKTLEQTGQFVVVAQTSDLSATYSKVEELLPDIVIIADSFARQEEYQCMLSLFRAVEARAVTLLGSQNLDPSSPYPSQIGSFVHSRMSVHEVLNALSSAVAAPVQAAFAPKTHPPATHPKSGFQRDKVILLGASTGGIDALTTILQHFPLDCPPTAIVQHTGQNFSETLARLLDRRCAAEVVLAETGLEMKSGRICLAGGIDGHLRLEHRGALRCAVSHGPATSGHRPSIDELFASAVPMGNSVVAALLTGMGRDGATGLLRLRQAGATTFGQDESSSVVYGMPRVAHEMGAVQRQLPLLDIGPALLQACAQTQVRFGKVGT